LNSYLKLEQLRFGFLYHISVAEDLDTRGLEIPSLFLQPAVENAVKHGVSGLQEKGTINVRFFRIDADLFAEIRDNGGGFHPPPAMGYGLKLTKERVDLLNQLFKGKEISQKIESSPEGTLVQFIFSGWL
jgi:two-component system, LytTR family, sensor kinase